VVEPISLEAIRSAQRRVRGSVLRTPLIPLSDADASVPVYLKPENLQPTGSFKVRGAGNALLRAREQDRPIPGVWTTSAGNMAQALAWHARRLGIPCTVVVPRGAPETKLAGIESLGARVVQRPWDDIWEIAQTGRFAPLDDQVFVHPFNDPHMIAGNGTIGLEIAEELPEVRTVYVPFGGGGLITGIASALRALRPDARAIACEPATAAPFAASLREGAATEVERTPSFVDGIGARSVLPEMWERLRDLVRDSRVLSLGEIARAVRFLFERHRLVVEGAGAASLAATRSQPALPGPAVAIVSGGNLDPSKLLTILEGRVP
jgi:threonine dehydratase